MHRRCRISGATVPILFHLDESKPNQPVRRDLMLLLQVGGLLATGWLVWSISVLPRLNRQPWYSVALESLKYALFACVSSGVITLALYLVIHRRASVDAFRTALRVASTAIWFAPATILLAELSPAALPAALVLVVSATRLLYSQWRFDQVSPSVPAQHPSFDPPEPPRLSDLAPGLTASLGIQAGVVAVPLGYPILSAALFALSVAMLTLCALRAGAAKAEGPSTLPRSVLGLLLTLILAAGLTMGGLGGDMHRSLHWSSPLQHRPGPLQSARALLQKLFYSKDDTNPSEPATTLYFPSASGVDITDKSFPGVVLFTTLKPHTVVVAPAPSWTRTSPDAAPTKPWSIPFSGQYWMYRPPNDRPPQTSHVQQGNPLTLSFRTTDRAPMYMEARQRPERPINLACCRAIRIVISNADGYARTVGMELVMIDTHATGQPSLSLGIAEVLSRPFGDLLRSPVHTMQETLDFDVPPSAALREFDQIQVIFHRGALRREHSARISIEHFVLVPRGF